jgi:hypothetical protein
MSTSLPHIPYHVVRAHILPLLGVDARLAFGVPPARLRLSAAHIAPLESMLKQRLRAVRHSPGAALTWAKVRIPCTGKMFVYRVHGAGAQARRGCDLVDYRSERLPFTRTLWSDD